MSGKWLIGVVNILILLLGISYSSGAQKANPWNSVQKTLSMYDTLNPFGTYSLDASQLIEETNFLLAKSLENFLADTVSINQNLDSLLNVKDLSTHRSADKRIWITHWDEKTGGSWRSQACLFHYRDTKGKPHIFPTQMSYSENTNLQIPSEGAGTTQIIKLRNSPTQLYLWLSWGQSCNTCIYQIARIIELNDDTCNLFYPGFGSNNSLKLEARMGNLSDFHYNKEKKILTAFIEPDDMNDLKQAQKICLKFTGVGFENFPQKSNPKKGKNKH